MPACDVLVIGGGPAGLRVAELTSAAGLHTVLADRMPSVGRKFLVAGMGGLNLTHSEPLEQFVSRYSNHSRWHFLLNDFSPDDLRAWASALGIESFVGTSGRVFPKTKQAAPLLRRWISRLKQQGVQFCLRHDWSGIQPLQGNEASFETPTGKVAFRTRTIVLTLGGASWPQTGSNGRWVSTLKSAGIRINALEPSNCGYEVDWPASFLADAEGCPLKNIKVLANGTWVAGELLITRYGLEGGALYQLGHALRTSPLPCLTIDLKPDFTAEQLAAKMHSETRDLVEAAARAWKLNPAAKALLRLAHAPSANALAVQAKGIHLQLRGPRPLDEAISTAGGVAWPELTDDLMLRRLPGVFCAGEMIDWDAPTGGYLLQGCFATATRAARGVISRLSRDDAAAKLD
jgi:uncharacterized flavoprotein (TIGR03862 family)